MQANPFRTVLPAALCAAGFLYANCALAQDSWNEAETMPPRVESDDEGIISLSWENDLFSNSDDNYTNGVRIAYLSPEDTIPMWLDRAANNVPLFSNNGHKRWHVAFGQSMFTPNDLSVRALQVNDRPYAGWTYGSIGMISDTGRHLENLQLTLGVVGPASGADDVQDFVHDLVGSPDPQGWDNQLKNELGVMITYERKWRNMVELTPFGLGVDVTPSLGASIGNVYTHAAAGAVVRLGYDLPSDYGPPLISPNLPGSDFFIPTQRFGWYLFTGIEARAVARNIFLDGNTFTDSHSVDKRNFVGGLQAGAAISIGDVRVAYTHIFRTEEFKRQPDNDQYGALNVSWRF